MKLRPNIFILVLTFLFIGSISPIHIKGNNISDLDIKIVTPSSTRHTEATTEFNNYATLQGQGGRISDIEFSPDDSILASSSADGSIWLWNMSTGEVVKIFRGHYFRINTIDFSPDGKIMVSGGNDGRINFYNISSGKVLQTFSISKPVLSLAFSPNGAFLAFSGGLYEQSQENILKIIDTNNMEKIHDLQTDYIHSITYSPVGSLLAGTWNNTIKIWNASTLTEINSFEAHTSFLTSISFSPNGKSLATSSLDKTIKVWDTDSWNLQQTLNAIQGVTSIDYSPDGLLASAGANIGDWEDDAIIQIWNTTTGELMNSLSGYEEGIAFIEYSHDGTILGSGENRLIKLWGEYPPMVVNLLADDWEESSPEEQGMNSTLLDEVNDLITQNDWVDLHSMLVIRHGKLVYEKYYEDHTNLSKHPVYSITKSISSALIGIAIEEGFIQNLDQKVVDFFPEFKSTEMDSRMKDMTLEHLLTLTTGIDWVDDEDYWDMAISNDIAQHFFSLPMRETPGEEFNYNSGASDMLTAIIQKTTGDDTLEFAFKHLFTPLGLEITDIHWVSRPSGLAHGGTGLFLTPRNMAKFGQLYLNNGSWDERQLIPADWVAASTRDYISDEGTDYGYQWWLYPDIGVFAASGAQGQNIFVAPKHDLVVVFTSGGYSATALVKKILNSVYTDEPLTSTEESRKGEESEWPVLILLPTLIMLSLLIRRRKIVQS